MTRQRYRLVLSVVGVAIGILGSHAVAQVPAPRRPAVSPRVAPAAAPGGALRLPRLNAPGLRLPELDSEDLLARALSAQQPLRAGRIHDFSSARVAVGTNSSETLGEISARAFADQAITAVELTRVPAAALSGAPEVVDEAYELPHSYLISRTVRFTVDDSARVAAQKGRLAEIVRVDHPQKRSIAFNQLTSAQQRAVDKFINTDSLLLPAGDPLRGAARQGRAALLRAAHEGRGTYEIVDTIEIPKRPPPVLNGVPQIHDFQNGLFDFSRTHAFSDPRITSRLDFGLTGDDFRVDVPDFIIPEPPPLLPTPEESVEGMRGFSSEFLAGFTRSKEWRWERRWNFPLGFFRATFGAGYRFGVRIPIEVRGTVSPTRIARRAPRDQRDELTTRLMATTLDADAEFYRATGLPANKVHDAKELLVGAYVLYGWKLNVFGVDLVHRRWTTIEIDADADFRPPFGRCNRDCGLDIWFPTGMTRTHWDVGVGQIAAPLGLHLTGDGSVSLDYEPTLGTAPAAASQTLEFGRRENAIERRNRLAAFEDSDAEKFGFRLRRPKYEVDLVMIPQLRLEARLGSDALDFHKTFRTDPIRLNAARIPLGSLEFERHAGTRSELAFSAGVKSFRRLEEPRFSLEGERGNLEVGLRVERGGSTSGQTRRRFLTSGGRGVGAAVHAASSEIDASARFRLIILRPGQFLIQRHDGRYWEVTPNGIRASASRERATLFTASFLEDSGLHMLRDARRGALWLTLDGQRLTVGRQADEAVKFRVWRAQ